MKVNANHRVDATEHGFYTQLGPAGNKTYFTKHCSWFLKEQKGHSYLISLRKPKPGAERALSVSDPPSVLDYLLTPAFPEPTVKQPQPCTHQELSLGSPASPSYPRGSHPYRWAPPAPGLASLSTHPPGNDQGQHPQKQHRAREASSCPEGHNGLEHSLKLHTANQSCHSETLKYFSEIPALKTEQYYFHD